MKKVLFAVLFFALGIGPSTSLAEECEERSTIEVAAAATAEAMPNTVTLSVAVETDAPLAKDAVRENAETTTKVLSALEKVVEKEGKLRTAGFSLSPVYEKDNPSKPGGYRVRNTIVLESKALDKVGLFIDRAVEAGASRVDNLTFTSDREEEIKREAAVEALKQARADAEALAKASGLSITKVIRISHTRRESPPFGVMREALMAGVRTPVAVGEISFTAGVHVVFEVE